jgi:hypothetical protein
MWFKQQRMSRNICFFPFFIWHYYKGGTSELDARLCSKVIPRSLAMPDQPANLEVLFCIGLTFRKITRSDVHFAGSQATYVVVQKLISVEAFSLPNNKAPSCLYLFFRYCMSQ